MNVSNGLYNLKKNDITTLTDIIKVYFTFQAKKNNSLRQIHEKKPMNRP